MKAKKIAFNLFVHQILGTCFVTTVALFCLMFLQFWGLIPGALMLVPWYWFLKKRVDKTTLAVNAAVLGVLALVFTVLMVISGGNTEGGTMLVMIWVYFPGIVFWTLLTLMGTELSLVGVLVTALLHVVIPAVILRWKPTKKQLLSIGCALLAFLCVNGALYANRPQVRYKGHGFDYMNGLSTTDFTDYRVTSDSGKLARLDSPSALRLETNLPVMDGAEACYPLYAAVAKEVYANIEQLESPKQPGYNEKYNGNIVQFSNTVYGFDRLVEGEVDLFFGAAPSADQKEWAKECAVDITVTPIGREAFVFFVEEDNPIEGLTSEQMRKIYSGEITNWKEVGGKNQAILPFQRPLNSGSQTMMVWFMGDTPLAEPKSYEVVGGMGDTIRYVVEYSNERGALGYSFRYFVEGLSQEKGVKLLAIDGVAPTVENIENGSYPLTIPLCLVTRTENTNENVQKMIDFMLSPQGQELVKKTGYGPLG